ncbi:MULTISPECIES: hypothetical protein [Microbacterium]|uniref:hypothetical protein n=1 Tax=Microbacterium TaxID=33882 RepID=UPI002782F7D4|nr:MULTISPECIES: hypothetical protein [Microbacterium]MDQ1077339.1 hypothetical protein [Microbacterium sp. SORGH_AS_0969]MDQ1117583.1 hypothetical protein [Microbacterium testaceum]
MIRRRSAPLIALTLIATALAGCTGVAPGDDSPDEPAPQAIDDGAATEAPDGTDATTSPASGSYPTCDEVKSALGPEVAELVEVPGSENGERDGSSGHELACTWMTPQTAQQSLDLNNYGGISIGIMRDPSYVEKDYDDLGWTIDDPRLAADDAWALTAGGQYDPAAQVNITSVQVVRDGTVVVITGGGVALQDVPELAALTEGWAVGAGLSVLDLMR